jgi:DNA-binding PadR family transcriptional regulator
LSDEIVERLRAVAERGQTLQQIAEAEPIAPVSGLSQIELTVLAVAAGAALPEQGFSLWQIKSDGEKLGLSAVGISLALRRLFQKQFLKEEWVEEGGNEPYKGAAISSKGWDWIDTNDDSFMLRRAPKGQKQHVIAEITDDDIPF